MIIAEMPNGQVYYVSLENDRLWWQTYNAEDECWELQSDESRETNKHWKYPTNN